MILANIIISTAAVIFLVMAATIALWVAYRSENILIKLVALEVMVNLFICGVGIWAVQIRFYFLIDICIALSLIMFLSTIAYCQFLLKQEIKDA